MLGITLELPATEQGPGYGGAMLAAVACGEYASVADACAATVSKHVSVVPDPELVAKYDERYKEFSKIYPACKEAGIW